MTVLVQYVIVNWLFGGELSHIMSHCNNFQIVRRSFKFFLSNIDSLSFGLTTIPQYKSSTWSCAVIGYLSSQAIFVFLLAKLTFKVPVIWISFPGTIVLTLRSHLGHKRFIQLRFFIALQMRVVQFSARNFPGWW